MYALVQGLLDRGVQAKNIIIAVPNQNKHVNEDPMYDLTEELPYIYPDAFEDEKLEQRMQALLEAKGATFIKECKLIEIISDKDKFIEAQQQQKSQSTLH